MQGTSRYEVMLQPMKPLRYSHLRSCGHTAFTGPPLRGCLAIAGAPLLDLWVASSDTDADIFAYLEDVDPASGKARWVCPLTLFRCVSPLRAQYLANRRSCLVSMRGENSDPSLTCLHPAGHV